MTREIFHSTMECFIGAGELPVGVVYRKKGMHPPQFHFAFVPPFRCTEFRPGGDQFAVGKPLAIFISGIFELQSAGFRYIDLGPENYNFLPPGSIFDPASQHYYLASKRTLFPQAPLP